MNKTTETNTTSTRTVLSHTQFYQLCHWMSTADLQECRTKPDVAKAASKALGFPLSESSIGNALEATGKKLTPADPNPTVRRDRSVIVARALVDLMKNLGYTLPTDLVAVSQSQSLK